MQIQLTEEVLHSLKMRPKSSLDGVSHVDLVNNLAKAMFLQSEGDISAHDGYRTLIELAELRQTSSRVVYERPPFLTPDLLQSLRQEKERNIQLNRFDTFATFSPQDDSSPAVRLSRDPEFAAWLSERMGLRLTVSHDISYMVYQKEGDGRFPHLDIELYSFNCLMVLEHTPAVGQPSSKTCLFDREGIRMFHLRPGEILSFNASAKLHSRSRLGPGEKVTLLTIGLRPE